MTVVPTYEKEALKEAAATSDTVLYTFSLVNNGLLSLYDISLSNSRLEAHGIIITCVDTGGTTVIGTNPGAVIGLAPYPHNGLAPAEKLVCTGTDLVFQDEVGPNKRPRNDVFRLQQVVLRRSTDKLVFTSDDT